MPFRPCSLDEDLVDAWAEWWTCWSAADDPDPLPVLTDLQAHLAEHGFAVVRRLVADPPPPDPCVEAEDRAAAKVSDR